MLEVCSVSIGNSAYLGHRRLVFGNHGGRTDWTSATLFGLVTVTFHPRMDQTNFT